MDEFLNHPTLFQSTNLFYALIGILGLVLNYKREKSGYTEETIATLRAWDWIYGGFAIRGAWFFLLWAAGGLEGERTFAQSFFYDYRIFALLVSSGMVGWGVLSFVRIIEERSEKWTVGVLGALIVASGIGAL